MGLRTKEIEEAAFWEGWVCLQCDHVVAAEEELPSYLEPGSCPSCENQSLVEAVHLSRFLTRLEADEDED